MNITVLKGLIVLETIAIITVALLIYFTIGWYISFRVKVFAYLDFYWCSSFLLIIGILIARNPELLNFSQNSASIILFILYGIWSIRLSSHLFTRIRRTGEDKRYIELKKKWKMMYGVYLYGLFVGEAILNVILSIPLYLVISTQHSEVAALLGIIIFFIAIIGEATADSQLKSFIKNKENQGKVCNVGLWKFSRHPNYFFETLVWAGFGIYGLGSELITLIGLIPYFIMLYLITNVTGVPPAEESSLRSKGDLYREYQKTTNRFLLWFPKQLSLIILSILVLSFLGGTVNKVYAKEDTTKAQAQRIEKVFNELREDNVHILDKFYAKDTLFIDPIGRHEGIKAVKDYYAGIYKGVEEIKFEFSEIISNGNNHVGVWKMTLTTPNLNSGKPVILHGNSVIKFNDEGLVSYHRDYFDMGEFIYEHIPLLGSVTKYVKKRLKGE